MLGEHSELLTCGYPRNRKKIPISCVGIEVENDHAMFNSNRNNKMYTTKYRNCAPVDSRNNNVFFDDQLFRDFFNGAWKGGSISPASNVKESDENYTIELAAPGLEKGDFKIKLDNHVLTISSEKKEENSNESERYTRKEFQYNSFQRSWNLPETIDTDAISASYNNGILNVVLPKKQDVVKNTNKVIEIA